MAAMQAMAVEHSCKSSVVPCGDVRWGKGRVCVVSTVARSLTHVAGLENKSASDMCRPGYIGVICTHLNLCDAVDFAVQRATQVRLIFLSHDCQCRILSCIVAVSW